MRTPHAIPVILRGEGGEESWGRLEALTPLAARIETLGPLPGDRLDLEFSLQGEAFLLPGAVAREEGGEDGYRRTEVRFLRHEDRLRLRDAIARILLTTTNVPK